jgi:hypothetical protein
MSTYRKRDLHRMRAGYRDDSEWKGSLSKADQQLLKSMIAEVRQDEPGQSRIDSLTDIRPIVAKGKIEDTDEYRLIMNRVNEIHQDPDAVGELRRLNELLSQFDSIS